MSVWQHQPLVQIGLNVLLNGLYLIMLFLLSYLYLYLRNKSFVDVRNYILLCISVWFEPVQFILFNTASFILSLLAHYLLSIKSRAYKKFESVPLAGYQSLCLIAVVVYPNS
jgi:hypothetical protein